MARQIHLFLLGLAACTNEAFSAAPQAQAASTGALACDEYLDLARACVTKERIALRGPADVDALDRSLRALAAGTAVPLDLDDVWTSALRWAHGKDRDRATRDLPLDVPAPDVACRRGVDQLPADCQ